MTTIMKTMPPMETAGSSRLSHLARPCMNLLNKRPAAIGIRVILITAIIIFVKSMGTKWPARNFIQVGVRIGEMMVLKAVTVTDRARLEPAI